MSKKKLKIDWETADRITVCTLREYRKNLKKELKKHKSGGYLHPEDVANHLSKIQIIEVLLKDFQ